MNSIFKSSLFLMLTLGSFSSASATAIDDVVVGYGRPKSSPSKIVSYSASHNEYGNLVRREQVSEIYYSNGRFDSLRAGLETTKVEYGDETKMTLENDGASIVIYVSTDSTRLFRYSQTNDFVSKDLSNNDDHGNPIVTKFYNDKGEFLSSVSFSYEYDSEGRFVEKKTFDANGVLVSILTRKYSPNGVLVLQRVVDKEGVLKSIIRYNQQGDAVEQCDYLKGKNFRKLFKYKYDEKGNWIQRQFIKNNLEKTETTYELREITY